MFELAPFRHPAAAKTNLIEFIFVPIVLFAHNMCSNCFAVSAMQIVLCSLSTAFGCAHLAGVTAQRLSRMDND